VQRLQRAGALGGKSDEGRASSGRGTCPKRDHPHVLRLHTCAKVDISPNHRNHCHVRSLYATNRSATRRAKSALPTLNASIPSLCCKCDPTMPLPPFSATAIRQASQIGLFVRLAGINGSAAGRFRFTPVFSLGLASRGREGFEATDSPVPPFGPLGAAGGSLLPLSPAWT
jgi:hypothetical protein